MSIITMSTGGSVSGEVTAEINAKTEVGSIVTGETTGNVTIPAGALWANIKNAGAVSPGDLPNAGTVNSGTWSIGREEKFNAVWNTALNEFNYLPEIEIEANGARFFYSYLA